MGEMHAMLFAFAASADGRYLVALLALGVALRWWRDARQSRDPVS